MRSFIVAGFLEGSLNPNVPPHEPPKLKTTLKTPPKQATNPLQFVKVGPCSLYRSAQEQLQKVQETKKIKQEVRDDPEDWQSNLDNWKSSRRKRQEHIIERVVEVKKLELEEHDRQRRRSKTFSEMMEERGSRGRKLSMSLAMYHEEDVNDLSDLGIGTSSGKSSVSGDTHDDTQSVMSDRDSEIEKNQSDVENTNDNNNVPEPKEETPTLPTSSLPLQATAMPQQTTITETSNTTCSITNKSASYENEFRSENDTRGYDSGNTATASSPEPEEYTYEGAIRGYVSRVSQNIPRRSLINLETTREPAKSNINEDKPAGSDDDKNTSFPIVKVDVLKRREIFERASRNSVETRANNMNNNSSANPRSSAEQNGLKSIKNRLSCLEKQKSEIANTDKELKASNRLSGDMSSIRERLSHLEKQTSERENKVSNRKTSLEELENSKALCRERVVEKFSSNESPAVTSQETTPMPIPSTREKDKIVTALANINEKSRPAKNDSNSPMGNGKNSLLPGEKFCTPAMSERSSSPDSEYRDVPPRASFHRSLDSLDADASSGHDNFERVQSLEELDYTTRYPASSSSAELLNDLTDREDSGIHTADVSCSVSQADEPVDEEVVHHPETIHERQEIALETHDSRNIEDTTRFGRDQKTENPQTTECQLDKTPLTNEESIIVERPTEEVPNPEEKSANFNEEDSQMAMPDHRQQRRIYEIQLDEPEVLVTPAPSPRSCPPSSLKFSSDTNSTTSINSSPPNNDAVEMNFDLAPASKQIPQLNLASDEELVTGLTFPLGPLTSVEPPKEKPPPPPTDLTDEEDNLPIEPLKRLNSTRRIKKELRTRRSDFLGIEGLNDDYLERELTLTKPPDMAAILAEERRVEQLNRRSYDTDSNYERDSSHERDSGVELGHAEDWRKQPVSPDMSEHSRQSSEPFGASVTSSEEDEITKKEREIIEVLEKEEQWRYGNNREQNSDIGEKLAHKLRELEEEKMQLERERAQESELRHRQEEIARQKEEDTLREQMEQREAAKRASEAAKRLEEQKIRDEEILRKKAEEMRIQQKIEEENERRQAAEAARRQEDSRRARSMEINQKNAREQMVVNARNDDDYASGEVLRVERELLQLEQEELKRRRTNVAYRQQRQLQLAEQLQEQWQSLQDVANGTNPSANASCCKYQVSVARASAPVNYRSSMPNLWLQENQRRRPPPPPIPPSKPSRLIEQMHRDVTIRNSRIPSADSIPQQVEGERLIRGGSTSTLSNNGGQQMTKQTLQALSAVPRPRIVKGDEWVQRRKSDVPRGTLEYNYQHWLIQEAEQRRINEKNQRSVVRKPQQHVTGTSVPYSAVPQTSRSDNKPLPDSIIQTLTQRVQNRAQERPSPPPPPQRRRLEQSSSHEHLSSMQHQTPQHMTMLQHQKVHQFAASHNTDSQEKMLSVSGKKKCSHCGDELGRGAAMIIESLRLFYHMECFKCCVCHVRLGDGLMGTDVRVRNHKLHCHNCYSSDDGVKFSCV
ncbi:trichohyalin isoform X4 [Venturia canescens]|uniref:trichohyalin isoform X4 n=1 Tax=Venturia canescens TaxID=32260 RepID=UPI001C9CDB90|nr:trichohyalin isoform X4 [Venturia canescens]